MKELLDITIPSVSWFQWFLYWSLYNFWSLKERDDTSQNKSSINGRFTEVWIGLREKGGGHSKPFSVLTVSFVTLSLFAWYIFPLTKTVGT